MLRPSLRSTLNVSSVSETFKASGILISTAKVACTISKTTYPVYFKLIFPFSCQHLFTNYLGLQIVRSDKCPGLIYIADTV